MSFTSIEKFSLATGKLLRILVAEISVLNDFPDPTAVIPLRAPVRVLHASHVAITPIHECLLHPTVPD